MATTARLVIVDCTTGWSDRVRYYDLFVFEDAIVVTTGSMKGIVTEGGLVAGRAPRTGRRARVRIDDARVHPRRNQTVGELLTGDRAAVVVRAEEIVEARLRRGVVNSRLLLVLRDGARRKFLWLRGHNDHAEVREGLGAVLGDRLRPG